MRFRKLRIAWSTVCLPTTVLLVVLWGRSYSYIDSTKVLGHDITTWRGQLFLDETFLHTPTNFDDADVPATLRRYHSIDILTTPADDASRFGVGWAVSFWLLVGVTIAFAIAPWIRWRFSLRSLLIATTLLAMMLGLVVWLR
jgi:hypothetical protein